MTALKLPLLIFMRYYRSLGLRVSFYAALALALPICSPLIVGTLSDETTDWLGFAAVEPVLTILASSMLAVSTFSLNVMVSSHRMAASTTTPRMHRLLLEDTTTQSVLAVFIGAFVFALTSIVLFQAQVLTDRDAVVVMAVTIAVAAGVVLAMLRWIGHLSTLGSMEESLRLATVRADAALSALARDPALRGQPLTDATVMPVEATTLRAAETGILQLIDVAGLQRALPEAASVYVLHSPGTHVLKGQTLARIGGRHGAEVCNALRGQFTFGPERTHEQDAAYGLTILSEIGTRALSPGINDPGTAIAVLQRLKGLLWDFAHVPAEPEACDAPNVFVPVTERATLVRAAFAQIAREGAGTPEVAATLLGTLRALGTTDDPAMRDAVQQMRTEAEAYCDAAAMLPHDRARLPGDTDPSP
jgi:uncharacterized membrane protein